MKNVSQENLINEISFKNDSLDCLDLYKGRINDQALTTVIEAIETDVFNLTEQLIQMRDQEEADLINGRC